MTHRPLHHCVRCDPTETRAKHVPQMVDRWSCGNVSYLGKILRRFRKSSNGLLNGFRVRGYEEKRGGLLSVKEANAQSRATTRSRSLG
jgi:ribosomal protein S27AE